MSPVPWARVVWSIAVLVCPIPALSAAADGTLIPFRGAVRSVLPAILASAAGPSEKLPSARELLPGWLRKEFSGSYGVSSHNREAKTVVLLKKRLLEDFKKNAKIPGLVAVISYPFCGEDSLVGHVELELEGRCLTLLSEDKLRERGGVSFDAKLRKKVRAAHKTGLPFYRYLIAATPEQIKHAEEGLADISGYTPICSLNVCTALARYVDFKVPLPAALCPTATAAYLSYAKGRSTSRVTAIEFYGDDVAKKLATRGTYREIYAIANLSGFLLFMMYLVSTAFSV